jgi:hypothetical protein
LRFVMDMSLSSWFTKKNDLTKCMYWTCLCSWIAKKRFDNVFVMDMSSFAICKKKVWQCLCNGHVFFRDLQKKIWKCVCDARVFVRHLQKKNDLTKCMYWTCLLLVICKKKRFDKVFVMEMSFFGICKKNRFDNVSGHVFILICEKRFDKFLC